MNTGFSKFVKSSWIRAVSFNARLGVLSVQMRTGKTYRAFASAADAQALANATSVGRAFNALNKGRINFHLAA